MKVERRDDGRERDILTGCILSRTVLGRVAARWDGNLFASPSANAVADLCVAFYRKHGKAPRRAITSLFADWSEGKDESTVQLAETLLQACSGEHRARARDINVELLLDQAGDYFNKVRLTRLKDHLEAHLAAGKVVRADEEVHNYLNSKVQLGVSSGIDPLHDKEFMRSVWDDPSESIIKYPGALGQFFGDDFGRDCFVSFAGPEKSCKTAMLLDAAYRATKQRRLTAFFGVGDMSAKQVAARFYSRLVKMPWRSSNGIWPCTVQWPRSISCDPSDETASVEHDEIVFDRRFTFCEAERAAARFINHELKSKKTYLRWHCCPAGTATVEDIDNILTGWELEGWGPPDAIIVDYADILAPPKGTNKLDFRDQTNRIWIDLRALAMKRHALVVTATQTNRESYDARTINRRHASEDKRKWAQVSSAIGLNITADEKEKQLMRVNHVQRREGAYNWTKVCHVAQCLALANPCVRSCF